MPVAVQASSAKCRKKAHPAEKTASCRALKHPRGKAASQVGESPVPEAAGNPNPSDRRYPGIQSYKQATRSIPKLLWSFMSRMQRPQERSWNGDHLRLRLRVRWSRSPAGDGKGGLEGAIEAASGQEPRSADQLLELRSLLFGSMASHYRILKCGYHNPDDLVFESLL